LKSYKIAIYVVLFVLAGGIYYYVSQNNIEQTQTAVPDSVSAPERPVFTTQEDTMPEPVGEDLAPGTALISAEVLDGSEKQITVLVGEVLGYGSATPVIVSDTELTILVENYLKANPDRENLIEAGAEISALVSHQKAMVMRESGESSRWTLKEIKQ
jgi:hypothetical protein